MDTPGGNPEYFYDDDSLIGKLKKDPDYIKKLNAKNAKKEHHNDEDFPGKDLSAWDLLDKIKAGDEELYDRVEAFMKSMNEMNSLGSSGAGSKINTGNSMDFSTPNAFGDDKEKKMKTYKSIGYKKA